LVLDAYIYLVISVEEVIITPDPFSRMNNNVIAYIYLCFYMISKSFTLLILLLLSLILVGHDFEMSFA